MKKDTTKKGSIKQERLRKKRRKKKLIAWSIILFILAVLALIVVKVFTVESVEVEGNVLYEDRIIEETVLNDDYSWNSLYVYFKYKFIKMEAVPFIDTMEVSLKSPHVVHIRVYEKGMLGYVVLPELGNVYFDKDGFVTEISGNVINKVPQICGLQVDEVVLYEKLPVDTDDLGDILILTQALKRNDMIPEVITYGVPYAPVLTYGDIQVMVGEETNLTKKLERLAKIYPTLLGKQGELHLENWTEETTNIIFVETPEEIPEESTEAAAEEESEETPEGEKPSENPN